MESKITSHHYKQKELFPIWERVNIIVICKQMLNKYLSKIKTKQGTYINVKIQCDGKKQGYYKL